MAIHTGEQIDSDLGLSCDVCVIGSGAGGAVVAAKLARAGKRVIVLEDGSFETSKTFDMTEAGMVPRLYQEKGQRATTDLSLVILQGRAVGGTTVINWTTCFRTPAERFGYWAEHHGVEGPTHEALVPHWEQIEQRLNIHQMLLEQVNANNRVLWDGCRQLGWEVALLKRNVHSCAHTGYCGVGCPIDAKQSMLVTFLPDAVNAGAEIYANAWVERVERDGRRISKVIARVRDPKTDRPSGRTITVSADWTVLSGGGINSPAVLLRSEIDPSGRTGKRTFLHPTTGTSGRFDHPIEGWTGSPQYVASHQFAHQATDRMSFLLEAMPIFPMSAAAFSNLHGRTQQEIMDTLANRAAIVGLTHDGFDLDDPDEGATVTLRPDGRPKVDYKWTPRLIEAFREVSRRTAEVQFAAGAREVTLYTSRLVTLHGVKDLPLLDEVELGPNRIFGGSAHVMGGCAMGIDPQTSVVDSRTLRHHALDNLFVIDGSVYPTSLGVNPQLSIYGLASWGADHVIAAAS